MGRLPCHDERLDDCTGQSARGQTGQGWLNLAAVDGKVLAISDGEGVQGHLWDITSSPRYGGRDRGWDSRHETAVATAFPGRRLGFPPH